MKKKIVIICPKCKKKMKILDRSGKYRCPNCKEIYRYTLLKKVINYSKRVVKGFFQTINDGIVGIKSKYIMFKNTLAYTRKVRKNMRSNPNWSNVQKEKNRMKEAERSKKSSFFNRFKSKKK